MCPPNTIDLSTVAPTADGNDDWYLASDFSQSRCENRLRSTDAMLCGPSCAADIFSLINDMTNNDIEFQPGNPNDCPARCEQANTTIRDLKTQPGWWRSNERSLVYMDCKRGKKF